MSDLADFMSSREENLMNLKKQQEKVFSHLDVRPGITMGDSNKEELLSQDTTKKEQDSSEIIEKEDEVREELPVYSESVTTCPACPDCAEKSTVLFALLMFVIGAVTGAFLVNMLIKKG